MKIFKDGAVYLVGELLVKVIPFAMLPNFTRVMGAEGFGDLSYILSIISLLSVFIGFSQQCLLKIKQ